MLLAQTPDRYLQLFLVDSPAWRWDTDTRGDVDALHDFVCELDTMLTNRTPRPAYSRVEWEERGSVLIGTHVDGGLRVHTYQDQQRERRTHDDGDTVTFEERTPTRTREKATEETARAIAERRTAVMR
jgi:hypothetical protein